MKKALLTVTLLISCTVAFSAAYDGYLYLGNTNQDWTSSGLFKVDSQTGGIDSSVDFSSGDMMGLVFVDDNYVWISNAFFAGEVLGSNFISRIDKDNVSTSGIKRINVNGKAFMMGIDENNVYFFLSSNSKIVKKMDKNLEAITDFYTSEYAGSSMIVDSNYVYIVGNKGSAEETLEVIDKSSGLKVAQAIIGESVRQLGPYVDSLWVAGGSEKNVRVYNKTNYTLLQTISLSGAEEPMSIMVDDYNAWIADVGDADHGVLSNVFIIDQKTYTYAAYQFGTTSASVTISNENVFICDPRGANVAVFDRFQKNYVTTYGFSQTGRGVLGLGDASGYRYDMIFSDNQFASNKKIKGKSINNNVVGNVVDDDITTYFEPAKQKSKITVKLNKKQKINNVSFHVKLLSSENVNLKWKLQRFKKGEWKKIKKGLILVETDREIEVGVGLGKKAKKFKLILKNKKNNFGNIGSYGVTKLIGIK